MLSGHNTNFIPDIARVGLALFYGGLVQITAGMWEFRNRNAFGSTRVLDVRRLLSLVVSIRITKIPSESLGGVLKGSDLANGLAWFLLSFAIFNTYMMLWSLRVNMAVFAVFLTLEITEILLAIGFWVAAHRGVAPAGADVGWIRAGGWAGIVTAAVAWYASAALVLSAMNGGRAIIPVGKAWWTGDRLTFGRRRRHHLAGATR